MENLSDALEYAINCSLINEGEEVCVDFYKGRYFVYFSHLLDGEEITIVAKFLNGNQIH